MSMVRFMATARCFFHAHTFGKTLFIEQEASIVAAYVDKSAKGTAEAQDKKRHRINAKTDLGITFFCAQISILGDAHALGDGKSCKATFSPRDRKIAAVVCQGPLDG